MIDEVRKTIEGYLTKTLIFCQLGQPLYNKSTFHF